MYGAAGRAYANRSLHARVEEEDDGGCFGDYECMGWNDYRACCSESFESCLMGFVMCSVICFSLIIIFFIFWIGSTAIDEADYQSTTCEVLNATYNFQCTVDVRIAVETTAAGTQDFVLDAPEVPDNDGAGVLSQSSACEYYSSLIGDSTPCFVNLDACPLGTTYCRYEVVYLEFPADNMKEIRKFKAYRVLTIILLFFAVCCTCCTICSWPYIDDSKYNTRRPAARRQYSYY